MGELCWRRGCALQMHQDGADYAGQRETRRPQSKEGDMPASGAAAATRGGSGAGACGTSTLLEPAEC